MEFIFSLPWITIGIAAGSYVGVVTAIVGVVWFFFGGTAAETAYRFVGVGIWLPLEVAAFPSGAVSWRERRLFKETFGFSPDTEENANRHEVDYVLRSLAAYAKSCFDDEEQARRDWREGKDVDLDTYSYFSKQAKGRFWKTHNLAGRFGYYVRDRIEDYLPYQLKTA